MTLDFWVYVRLVWLIQNGKTTGFYLMKIASQACFGSTDLFSHFFFHFLVQTFKAKSPLSPASIPSTVQFTIKEEHLRVFPALLWLLYQTLIGSKKRCADSKGHC